MCGLYIFPVMSKAKLLDPYSLLGQADQLIYKSGSLKWSECNLEIFSNIKLIGLKNNLCPPFGSANEKILSCLVHPQKNDKVGDGDRCNIASYGMRKT
jgi:hypothetical protein